MEKVGDGRLTDAPPPMAVRVQVTARLVDGGLAPGVTVALRVVELPGGTELGVANPVAVGLLGPPQAWVGDAELRGAGAAAAKSAELTLVSVQPKSARKSAVVFDSPGAALAPSKKFAVP